MGVIRLLLSLSVVRGHTEPLLGLDLVGGQRAVQLFYIVSGFYMTLILSGRYAGKSRFLFYSNRFLRIFPLYLAALLLMMGLAVGNQLLTGGSSVLAPYLTMWDVLSPAVLLLFIASNILILGQA